MTKKKFSLHRICPNPLSPTSTELELLANYALKGTDASVRMAAMNVIAYAAFDSNIVTTLANSDPDEAVRHNAESWLSDYDKTRAGFRARRMLSNPFGRSEHFLDDELHGVVTDIVKSRLPYVMLNGRQATNLGLILQEDDALLIQDRTLHINSVPSKAYVINDGVTKTNGCGIILSFPLSQLCGASYDSDVYLQAIER